ncbi:N-acetylmuramoyl-L-alanine amidase family protein [Xanthomonas hortorum]|uniref:N-acetylmuramoyl-L-alanine amidase n=13 Tax=Xanthomonas hortorum TaxID=56454 RepID=A0A6V7BTF1_9XANT|nr:N-acetylmuramoyl-L-alanine amidase [Xanthomonas hortorum]CAD0304189.1 hypothetical protein CFBP2533_05240 [Xanthomonas hortorum pv. pelargonii]CAD0304191.1 hypothetical protein CFBP2533_05240 [Xanthomonas hortorum pv. pelargonii]
MRRVVSRIYGALFRASLAFTLTVNLVFFVGNSSAANSGGAESASAVASLSKSDRSQLEKDLTQEAQRIVKRLPPLEGQLSNKHDVSARFDSAGKVLIVDLGRDYVPKINGAEFEDNLHAISRSLLPLFDDVVTIDGIEFRYSGKDIYYYFPKDYRPSPVQKKTDVKPVALPQAAVAAQKKVMISAGHGAYYHYGYKDWRYQRDNFNGVVEDLVTPPMSTYLSQFLISNSNALTSFVRSQDSTIHAPSGLEWWKVASRYYLANKYPELTAVWNSKSKSPREGDIERTEDLYARPLFANNQKVDALLHVHTNGVAETTARGLRIFYQTGRVEDKKFAESVHCYMKEAISTTPGYETYPTGSVNFDDNAETREATMPSVIAEVGFHTNPDDQLALKDPVFQKAAMRGFEKGYRMYQEGKACEPFQITETPNINSPLNKSFDVLSHYKGNPRFPVKRVSKATSCPSGLTCAGSTKSLTGASPFKVQGNCNYNGTALKKFQMTWEVIFTDADGVTAKTTYVTNCGA